MDDDRNPIGQPQRDELAELFSTTFAPFGGWVGVRTDYIEKGLQSLAQGFAFEYLKSTKRQLYCDVVRNDQINAFVTLEKDVYLVGITLGVYERLFNLTADVIKALDINFKGVQAARFDSQLKEVHFILYFYALAFVVGHECGHIKRGHIDDCLNAGQMASEVGASTSYVEEVEADTIGVLSMVFVKFNLYRLCELTDVVTAVGLLQVPLACVFSTLFLEAHQNSKDYPHPVARLFCAGRIILKLMPIFATYGTGFDDKQMDDARRMMTTILNIIDPKVIAHLESNVDLLKNDLKEMMKIADPIVDEWLDNSWEFGAFHRNAEVEGEARDHGRRVVAGEPP